MELTERIQRTCGHWETVVVRWSVGSKPSGLKRMAHEKARDVKCRECIAAELARATAKHRSA